MNTALDTRAAELQAMPRPTLETFARTLERELSAKTAECQRLREALELIALQDPSRTTATGNIARAALQATP